jgi:hypothetical protein
MKAFGTDRFTIYNTGTWGISSRHVESARSIASLCEKMISVDISSVARFPESPEIRTKVFNTSDQVSNCYYLMSNGVPVIESKKWFDHHCYGHDAKVNCIERALFLKKTT